MAQETPETPGCSSTTCFASTARTIPPEASTDETDRDTRAGAEPSDLARFEAEARAGAGIDHPNIIKIFEIGEHDGRPYFSLEFLEGGSLSQRIDCKSHRQLGYFAQHKMGDSQAALRHYQQSLEIARACVAKEPGNDKFKEDLANTLFMMANAESQLGHLEQLCHTILAREPELWSVVHSLARSYNNSGMLLYLIGRDPAGAREYHRKALELISRWVAADPTNAHAQERLATTLYYEATCARQSGDRAGAAAGYRRCLEIREKLATDPKAQIPRIDLMVAQARCGTHAQASAIASDLMARSPDNAKICFQSAWGFALSAGALRDQAPPISPDAGVSRLGPDHEAMTRDYADVVGLETDPDLEPIRDEPAFRTLLAEFPRPATTKP